jgi:hypothetical protein
LGAHFAATRCARCSTRACAATAEPNSSSADTDATICQQSALVSGADNAV